jgi:hypothetical protein
MCEITSYICEVFYYIKETASDGDGEIAKRAILYFNTFFWWRTFVLTIVLAPECIYILSTLDTKNGVTYYQGEYPNIISPAPPPPQPGHDNVLLKLQ